MRSIGATAVFEIVADTPPFRNDANGLEPLGASPWATMASIWGPVCAVHVSTYVWVHVCMWVHVCVHVGVGHDGLDPATCLCACMCAHEYMCGCLCVCACVCVHVCVFVCVFVQMCTFLVYAQCEDPRFGGRGWRGRTPWRRQKMRWTRQQ